MLYLYALLSFLFVPLYHITGFGNTKQISFRTSFVSIRPFTVSNVIDVFAVAQSGRIVKSDKIERSLFCVIKNSLCEGIEI